VTVQIDRYPLPTRIIDSNLGVIILVPLSQELLSEYVALPLSSWCWEHDGWWLGFSLVIEATLLPLCRFNLADMAHRAALADLIQLGCPLRVRPAASIEGNDIVGNGVAIELRVLDRLIVASALSLNQPG
jgi:hypothetical protein